MGAARSVSPEQTTRLSGYGQWGQPLRTLRGPDDYHREPGKHLDRGERRDC
jgi:hypothetical protein